MTELTPAGKAGREIGLLVNRIVELAPIAGVKVVINYEPMPAEPKKGKRS